MMSTIYKRANSSIYYYEVSINGQRIRISTRCKSKTLAKEVQSKWDRMRYDDDYSFISKNFHTLELESYFTNYKSFLESRKSQNTRAIADGVLDRFRECMVEQKIRMLGDIEVNHINFYIDWLDVASKTKKNYLNVVSLMFKQAIREKHITMNPCDDATLPKIIQKERHRLLVSADLTVIFKNSEKWNLYYAFLLYTGLRAGDVAMIRYENIDVKRKMITQLIRKSRRIHELPLADILLKSIGNIKGKEGPMFPTLYIEDDSKRNDRLANPRKYLQKILKDAELPKATLHSFRHTFNNLLLAQGLNLLDRQSLLAHSSSQTTQIYTHPNAELAAEYINELPNYLKSTSSE